MKRSKISQEELKMAAAKLDESIKRDSARKAAGLEYMRKHPLSWEQMKAQGEAMQRQMRRWEEAREGDGLGDL